MFFRKKKKEKETSSEEKISQDQKEISKKEKKKKKKKSSEKKATTQNTIRFKNLSSDGLMQVEDNYFSRSFKLGDIDYLNSSVDGKIKIIEKYSEFLNLFEAETLFQLTIVNRRIENDEVSMVRYDLEKDELDKYRKEYNSLIDYRLQNSKSFKTDKYITIGIEGTDIQQGRNYLNELHKDIENHFRSNRIEISSLDGEKRLALLNKILREDFKLNYKFEDMEASGEGIKSFIAPNRIEIKEKNLLIDDKFSKTIYIRNFPNKLGDRLIKDLATLDFEFVLNISALSLADFKEMSILKEIEHDSRLRLFRSQKESVKNGAMSSEFLGNRRDKDSIELVENWQNQIEHYNDKIFSGLFALYLKADSLEQLKEQEEKVTRICNKIDVKFEDIYYYQEEALNTILPLGKNFLDEKQKFSRKLTTSNIATQVPFTQVDLISKSDKAVYYGQNQLSNHMITLNRKKDLLTGSGVITGISGSGKSMTVKTLELMPNRLKYPNDEIIIVDPENEYTSLATEFGGQIIDISLNSKTFINVLELPDASKLAEEDRGSIIENKINLLTALFEDALEELNDEQVTFIDRVTTQTYKFYKNPTLREWRDVLISQPEEEAKSFAVKLEPYTIGSQSLFSNPTNVNLDAKFVVFNLNKLNGKLKPLALAVIQDFIWNRVVKNRGLLDTWLYFDELQLYFKTAKQAVFFTELYSRVRKYGAIPTGITQNVETIASSEEGRKLLSNSEFLVLLQQKKTDMRIWEHIISITEKQADFLLHPKAKGTGLIYAGGTIVPFENPIPEDTNLFQVASTNSF